MGYCCVSCELLYLMGRQGTGWVEGEAEGDMPHGEASHGGRQGQGQGVPGREAGWMPSAGAGKGVGR